MVSVVSRQSSVVCRPPVRRQKTADRRQTTHFKKSRYPLLHDRVKPRLKRATFLRVGEDLGGKAPTLSRIGDEPVYDVVCVDRRDAQLVQELRDERFAAGDATRQGDTGISDQSGKCSFFLLTLMTALPRNRPSTTIPLIVAASVFSFPSAT